MILSTQTDCAAKIFGDRKAVEMIAAAGFDAVDYSMFEVKNDDDHPVLSDNYEKYAHELRKTAEENGVFFNQSHAPFPSYINDDNHYNSIIFDRIKRSIEFSAILGVKQICVHPAIFPNDENREYEFNLEFYNSLIPTIKDTGIKIGVENMFWYDKDAKAIRPGACGTSQRMIRLFDSLDSKYFTCLLDIGHCGLVGEKAENFIRSLGTERLGALHVHDNNYKSDMHTLPFTCSINWENVTAALKDIKYAGEFTFEADCFLYPLPNNIVSDGLSFMNIVGRQLISMIEN